MRKNWVFYTIIIIGSTVCGPSGAMGGSQEPAAHRETACTLCHGGGTLASTGQREQISRRCLACHADQAAASHTAVGIHDTGRRNCLSCHGFHDAVGDREGDRRHASASPGLDSGHCRGCHSPEGNLQLLSPAHRIAAELYHTAGQGLDGVSPSESCLRCHAAGSASPWQNATGGRVLAFNTHASHPYGVMVIPGAGNSFDHIRWNPDERLPLFDGKMECQSCHLLTAGTSYDLISYENPYDLCLGCHRHEAAPGGTDTSAFLATMAGR